MCLQYIPGTVMYLQDLQDMNVQQIDIEEGCRTNVVMLFLIFENISGI